MKSRKIFWKIRLTHFARGLTFSVCKRILIWFTKRFFLSHLSIYLSLYHNTRIQFLIKFFLSIFWLSLFLTKNSKFNNARTYVFDKTNGSSNYFNKTKKKVLSIFSIPTENERLHLMNDPNF